MSNDTPSTPHTTTAGYLLVALALVAGTALTVGLSFVNLGKLGNGLAALAIAGAEAALVLYYCMHIRESARIIGIVAFGSFIWLAILFLFPVGDLLARSGSDIPKAQAFDPADLHRQEMDQKWLQYQHDLRAPASPDGAPATTPAH